MSAERVPYRNGDGYPDPTAYEAITNAMNDRTGIDEEVDERLNLLIKTLKNTIRLAGFELVSRIEVKDTKTGRLYL